MNHFHSAALKHPKALEGASLCMWAVYKLLVCGDFKTDIFAAGTDTTHTVLDWVMVEPLRHPKVMEKLQNEVRAVGQGKSEITEDDFDKMQYLKLVIKETLRLHSPVPSLVPRESTRDVKLIPFGAGPRGCPGKTFAMAINELASAKLLHKFDFALPDAGKPEDMDMTEAGGIDVHRKLPILVLATPYFP
ncbi:cytochrome P450 71A4-like [Coffea eugenioides]|uniref:cytochrome P450 71A4-like n=1 Tax=Coffea eugenioides TaxID=49369 RepID=UPI000F60E4E6|nr:cytochrome P450 71A4-like [Coffea eugenioides]